MLAQSPAAYIESMLVFPSLSTNIAPLSINLMPASLAKSLLGVTPIATTT